MHALFSGKADRPKAESAPANILPDLGAVRGLPSGVSKFRDFICQLPIHLSKYILSMLGCPGGSPSWPSSEVPRSIFCFAGMLDTNTLNKCASVSQHWAALAQQVKADLSMHTFIQNQVALLQVLPLREGQSGGQPRFCAKVGLTASLRVRLAGPQLASCPVAAASQASAVTPLLPGLPAGHHFTLLSPVLPAGTTPLETSQDGRGRGFLKPHRTGSFFPECYIAAYAVRTPLVCL